METVVDWFAQNWVALANVIMIDIVLAGDNAIVVGLAASQVAPNLRARVIFWGIAGAVVLRIVFAAMTAQLLQITGIMLFGGLLLFWVCWKMYHQIRDAAAHQHAHSLGAAAANADGTPSSGFKEMSFMAAIWQIIVADVSMSLDNVLAVAGAAKGSTLVLIIGLAVAIILMAVASHFIAKLLAKYPAITWIGLLVIVYVAFDMTFAGVQDVSCKVYSTGCDGLWKWVQANWLSGIFGGK